MNLATLYTVISISGASVLAIEILGTRILGPFYGVSLFLWSALITITLAALAVGYAIGGRWADRGPRREHLAIMLVIAGVWLLIVPAAKRPILELLEPIGFRTAILAASSLIFFVPLALLGMVSPYAIRLRAVRVEDIGRTAGDLFAVSTVASVVAALLMGFVLIPNIGVQRLTFMIGGFLILGAWIALGRGGSRLGHSLLILMLAGAGLLSWKGPAEGRHLEEGLLTVRQSPYAEIRVLDVDDLRYLFIDGGGHSIVEPGNWRTHFPYVAVMDINKHFFEAPGKALLIGLGGGSLVKSFAGDGWQMDAVEIDPVVAEVANEYFGLEVSECDLHIGDGRQFLIRNDRSYDLIMMDAFGSSSIPFHLVTKEAFGLVKSRLGENGVFAVNLEAVGWKDTIVNALSATLQTQFEHVLVLPLGEPPNRLGNLVMLASDRELDLSDDALGRPRDFVADGYAHWWVLTQNHAWDNRFTPRDGVVLTDDLNPVDLWAERINLAARKVLHEDKDWDRLSW